MTRTVLGPTACKELHDRDSQKQSKFSPAMLIGWAGRVFSPLWLPADYVATSCAVLLLLRALVT